MTSKEKNNIYDLLNDDGFIAWVTSGYKINNGYWSEIKAGLSAADKDEFNKAITILTKLRALHIDDTKSVKSQEFIKQQYAKLMADYNAINSKKSKVFKLNNWLRYAAVVVVLLSITGLAYLFNVSGSSFEAHLTETAFNTSDLLIQAPDEKFYKLSETNKTWVNEQGITVSVSDGAISFTPTEQAKTDGYGTYKLFVPKGKKYLLRLVDSTMVELNSNTRISFANALSTKQRKVDLKGEAFFDVTHNPDRPFVVQSSDLKIEVLGTEFNVSNYENNLYTSATLIEGSISVSNQQGESRVIKPGSQAILRHNQGRIEVRKVNVQNEVSWTTSRMIFEDETLQNIVQRLQGLV